MFVMKYIPEFNSKYVVEKTTKNVDLSCQVEEWEFFKLRICRHVLGELLVNDISWKTKFS